MACIRTSTLTKRTVASTTTTAPAATTTTSDVADWYEYIVVIIRPKFSCSCSCLAKF